MKTILVVEDDRIYAVSYTHLNTGDASINIYFKQGTTAEMAAVNVQNLSLIHI